MKTKLFNHLSLVSRLFLKCSMCFGLCAVVWTGEAKAIAVDTELVLLVDVTSASLNNTQYDQLMDGYSAAFTSSQVINSIASGATGRIAVSLMFFGNTGSQQVGIPWMMIENSTQAQSFANALQAVARPSFRVGGSTNVAAGITAAAATFGTEMSPAGPANGFESTFQIIEVAGGRVPNNSAAAAASSDAALAAGVDIINSLALGNQAATINTYYATNVIGSTVPGAAPTSTTSAFGTLGTTLPISVSSAITAVPEPGRMMLVLVSGIMFLLKRRR